MSLLGITQVDALALALLAVLALSFGCVLLILVAIYRRGRAVDCDVQKLLDEAAADAKEPEKAGPPATEDRLREPWERESDWWRK